MNLSVTIWFYAQGRKGREVPDLAYTARSMRATGSRSAWLRRLRVGGEYPGVFE